MKRGFCFVFVLLIVFSMSFVVAQPTREVTVGVDVLDSGADTDGDGVLDLDDNCPLISNPAQLDVDVDGKGDICDRCDGTPLDLISEIDSTGCVLPIYSEFNSGSTTNFYTEVNLNAVSNLKLGVIGKGLIIFLNSVLNVEAVDFDSNVEISNDSISVDSDNLPLLNRSANLQFFNLTFITPKVLFNGDDCGTKCKEISYQGGTLVVNVTSFSDYTIVEGEWCGDGQCTAGIGEGCSSCSTDCGVCPGDGGGGGGGGDGGSGGTTPPPEEEGGDFLLLSTCLPWVCNGWSVCDEEGVKTRSCTKNAECDISLPKPTEAVTCSCEEQWICDEWTECSLLRQDRECIDANACGTISNAPETKRICTDKKSQSLFLAIAIGIFTLIFVVVIALIVKNRTWLKLKFGLY